MLCLYWVKRYYRKTLKWLFLEILLSGGQTIDLRSNMRTCWRKSVKRAIKWAYPGPCSSSGPPVMCRFVEKCLKRQKLTFRDLWWPDLWPDLKNDKSFRHYFWHFFDCRLLRVTTWPRSRVRGGLGVKTPPPPARHWKHRPPARRALRA